MRVIYVDDESPVIDNFRLTVEGLPQIDTLHFFKKSEEALKWAEENQVDVAFLDIEMPVINGIELAKCLKQVDRNIRIIFVTAFEQYALEAFGVEALGYLLKPYTREEVREVLERAALMRSRPKKKVVIQTIPNFAVLVDGDCVHFGREKPEELLALLTDRGTVGVTAGEAIACLWPERPADENTHALYRTTFYRMMEALKKVGIDDIICIERRKKYIITERVDCDLYRILAGESSLLKNYNGNYMSEYSWAEERNAQLYHMKFSDKNDDGLINR